MIRFNFMCPHAVDDPRSQRSACRYVVFHGESSLPIQDDGGLVTAGTNEANVEEHFRRKVGTGEID